MKADLRVQSAPEQHLWNSLGPPAGQRWLFSAACRADLSFPAINLDRLIWAPAQKILGESSSPEGVGELLGSASQVVSMETTSSITTRSNRTCVAKFGSDPGLFNGDSSLGCACHRGNAGTAAPSGDGRVRSFWSWGRGSPHREPSAAFSSDEGSFPVLAMTHRWGDSRSYGWKSQSWTEFRLSHLHWGWMFRVSRGVILASSAGSRPSSE